VIRPTNKTSPFPDDNVIVCIALIAMLTMPLRSDAEAIDLMRFSRIGDDAKIELELTCEMRQEGFRSSADGTSWTVDVDLGMDCRLPLRNTRNEIHRPPGGRLADLTGIRFDRQGMRNATIELRFENAVDVTVSQTANRYMLTVDVQRNVAAPVAALPAAAPPAPVPVVPPSRPQPDGRISRRVNNDVPEVRNRFVIRLAVLTDDRSAVTDILPDYQDRAIYTQNIEVGGREWIELKLGFFDTEEEARRTIAALPPQFDSAWITVASPDEQQYAWQERMNAPGAAPIAATSPARVAEGPALRPAPTLTPGEVAVMLTDARDALVRRDYATSIGLYERLLEEPGGEHRQVAREFLGVARERLGEPDAAAAEYRAWLQEFPDGEQADRVRQRLAAVAPPMPIASGSPGVRIAAADPPRWEYYADLSQYYLRGVNMAATSEPDFIAQSALLSQSNLYVRHRGDRFDLIGRGNLGYLHDFRNGGEKQALVSNAYVDITDTRHDINARVGRQRQLVGGVLGLFDGAHVSYRVKPDVTAAVTLGYPIDSPRYRATGDHTLMGASVTFDNVIEAWDVTVFANQQRVDGILDRQAVGMEAQYQSRNFVVVGLLDYDASYNVINTALASGTWRVNDRLTVYGRARGGAAPFLTTRNAIIGQPVNTVRELFGTYSEGQIRRLARNRTADERAASGGVSLALTERLQLKAETSYLEYSATVASGGVDALPGSGPRLSWGGHLQGSGYFKAGNIFLVGYRHDETQSIDTNTAWFDIRYPVSERLRLQTRLSASLRVANQDAAGDIEHLMISPMVRLQYASERRWRIDFEAGSQWSNHEFPTALQPPLITDGDFEHSDYYLQLGYTVDFE